MMNVDEIIEFYRDAYLEGYNRSKSTSFTGKKRDANKYAASICPEGAQMLASYARVAASGKVTDKNGSRLAHSLRTLNLRQRFINEGGHIKNNGKFAGKDLPVISENGNSDNGILALYKAWVDSNDFVPNDAVLAHFHGNTNQSSMKQARSKLMKDGYEFTQAVDGWKVTARPVKKMSIDDMSKEEVIALLRKLL